MAEIDATSGELCKNCKEGHVETVTVPAVFTRGDTSVAFYDEFSRCQKCGDEFYTYEQSMAKSRAVTAAVRKSQGLPTGDEIRATRLQLGMSLPEFERAMGVGKKTIGRWERGTVPPTAAANLGLWLARNYPEKFTEYARVRGVGSQFGKRTLRTGAMGQTSQGPTGAAGPTDSGGPKKSLTLIHGGTTKTDNAAREPEPITLDREPVEA